MFRAEECDQLHTGRVREQIDAAHASRVATRVIGDQPDAFASNKVQRITHEDRDAGRDTSER